MRILFALQLRRSCGRNRSVDLKDPESINPDLIYDVTSPNDSGVVYISNKHLRASKVCLLIVPCRCVSFQCTERCVSEVVKSCSINPKKLLSPTAGARAEERDVNRTDLSRYLEAAHHTKGYTDTLTCLTFDNPPLKSQKPSCDNQTKWHHK